MTADDLLKEAILNALHRGVQRITFTKVNGDIREMKCTLKKDIIEKESGIIFEESKIKEYSPDVIRVFDTDIKEWRSFRFKSVLSIFEMK